MNDVTIIGELGINHDGSFTKAVTMLNALRATGVKIAKFQYYDAVKLLGLDNPYLNYAASCQFTKVQHEELKNYCDAIGLEYLVSVFDVADIPWADSLCKRHKVASRLNKNMAFIGALLNTNKQVVISTQSWNPMPLFGADYMYCITEYPTSLEKMSQLPCSHRLGLSSHCPSIAPSLAAVAQGARFIEHHVAFDRAEPGCDKSSSVTFDELKQLNRFANELVVIR